MTEKIKLPKLHVRASVSPDSINVDKRTVDVVFSTGYEGDRTDWWSGAKWKESLSLEKKHVDLGRLNSGAAPLLDSHRAWGSGSVIGVIESAETDGKTGTATVRFSKKEAAEEIFKDVQDGILKNVSVGYKVRKFEDITEKGEPIRRLRAVDWEPMEVSIVPMGFDPEAQIRVAGDQLYRGDLAQELCEVEIIPNERAGSDNERRGNLPTKEKDKKSIGAGTAPAPDPPSTENIRSAEEIEAIKKEAKEEGLQEGRKIEREIRGAVGKAGLSVEFANQLCDDRISVDESYKRIVDEVHKRFAKEAPKQVNGVRVSVDGIDATKTRMEAVESAILTRIDPVTFPLPELARENRGETLFEVCKRVLTWHGTNFSMLSKNQIVQRAMTSSDFPLIVENIATKTLLAGFAEPPQTFESFTRIANLPDFKEVSRVKLGEAPPLKRVVDHGEITYGSVVEDGEKYSLATYAKGANLSRVLIINDDLDALGRIPRGFGRQANNLESDLAWGIITSNPNMSDGKALFHADHNNLASAPGGIDDDSINVAVVAMMTQKGLDGVTHIVMTPVDLVVPVLLWRDATKFMSAVLNSTAANANVWAGRFGVKQEPRLDVASATAWYLFSNLQNAGDMLELGVLDGIRRPQLTTIQRGGVDGISIEIIYDVTVKAIEYRGMFKDAGE